MQFQISQDPKGWLLSVLIKSTFRLALPYKESDLNTFRFYDVDEKVVCIKETIFSGTLFH